MEPASRRFAGRHIAVAWLAAITSVGLSTSARAQAESGPILQLQPGMRTADFMSAPNGVSSATGFVLRFVTRLPTRQPWLIPVIGASFTPYGTTGTGDRDTDAPTLFAGNVFPLISPGRTSGWLTVEMPILIVHNPGAGHTGNPRDYGRDLVIQAVMYVHVGARVFREFGPAWSRLDLYVLIEQNLTPNKDATTGRADRFNPVALFGGSISLGGSSPRD